MVDDDGVLVIMLMTAVDGFECCFLRKIMRKYGDDDIVGRGTQN